MSKTLAKSKTIQRPAMAVLRPHLIYSDHQWKRMLNPTTLRDGMMVAAFERRYGMTPAESVKLPPIEVDFRIDESEIDRVDTP